MSQGTPTPLAAAVRETFQCAHRLPPPDEAKPHHLLVRNPSLGHYAERMQIGGTIPESEVAPHACNDSENGNAAAPKSVDDPRADARSESNALDAHSITKKDIERTAEGIADGSCGDAGLGTAQPSKRRKTAQAHPHGSGPSLTATCPGVSLELFPLAICRLVH
eukprot:m.467915 g.467915  ORF g.467915 m.467915 type:complete len:164 (-) comp21642_c1_seq28:215-706(-)